MDTLTLFGLVSVSLMLVAYALEERASAFVMLFACACGASSIYGFLAGTWPFGMVEAVWTIVAMRRWRVRVGGHGQATARPIACDMTALSDAERRNYDSLRQRVLAAVQEVKGTATGFRLRLDATASAPAVAEWMALEVRCCPFLTLQLSLNDDGTTWVEMGGSAAIKDFLRDEFWAFASP